LPVTIIAIEVIVAAPRRLNTGILAFITFTSQLRSSIETRELMLYISITILTSISDSAILSIVESFFSMVLETNITTLLADLLLVKSASKSIV
jgi:hypothetical protein